MKLCFPEEILRQHVAVLGKTGKGKSSTLRHVVEHLLAQGKRVCVIDPKGDWWGLKLAADGKGEGFKVIAFGDFMDPKASDVPINAQSGRQVAELIAKGNRPCVIGFRGWMTSDMVRFWIDFARTLFALNAGELFLVGDEFHNFAPKGKIMDPEAGKCLHWSNRLMSEGRGLGLVCLIASQRPQKVHNDALTCCETLIALGVTHKADRTAIQDWIEGCGDMEKGKEVLQGMAGLGRGQAYVWSPEIKFGPKLIQFPLFETFDSFAPPQLQKAIQRKDWSTVDLAEVREKMAAIVEEAKANDPVALKLEVRRLKGELEKSSKFQVPSSKPEIKEVPVFSEKELGRLELLISVLKNAKEIAEKEAAFWDEQCGTITAELDFFKGIIQNKFAGGAAAAGRANFSSATRARPVMISPRGEYGAARQHSPTGNGTGAHGVTRPTGNGNGGQPTTVTTSLGKAERKILQVLANYPDGKSKKHVALLSGYAIAGGGFGNALGSLRSQGFITYGDLMQITPSGLEANGPIAPLPSGEELYRYWMNHSDLGQAEREILRVLYQNGSLSKEDIAPLTVSAKGTPYEANGGGFGNALGKLRALELIEGKGQLQLSEVFFS